MATLSTDAPRTRADNRVSLIPNLNEPWDECSHLCTDLWTTVDEGPQRVDTEVHDGGRRISPAGFSTSVHDASGFGHRRGPHQKRALTSASALGPQFPHDR